MAKTLLSALEYDDAELSLLITDDAEIAELNSTYRNKQKPTDVLSFSQQEGEGAAEGILGDVVISLDTAERQAVEYEVSVAEELQRLLIHGVLHLCGYDHENVPEAVAEEMREKERELSAVLSKV